MKKATQKRLIEWGIKLVLGVAIAWAVWRQAFADKDWTALWQVFLARLSWKQLPWLLSCATCMPLNWLLESLKWHQLVRTFMPMSLRQSVKAVLAGVSVSIFTPNRIGEYAGRILMVEAAHNWRAIIATLVGSLAQNIILLLAGLIGGLWFARYYLQATPYVVQTIAMLGGLFISLLLLIYFHIDLVRPLARRLPWPHPLQRWLKQLNVLTYYNTPTLARVLALASLRYLLFSTQYIWMVWFFGIELSYGVALASVATIFLLQMGVPLPALVARGSIALFVWGYHTNNQLGILAASYAVFVLNLVFPALAGLILILRANILKSLGYE